MKESEFMGILEREMPNLSKTEREDALIYFSKGESSIKEIKEDLINYDCGFDYMSAMEEDLKDLADTCQQRRD